nr:MAG TPA: hypothetical protein [Bacteriophage sp.]
MRQVTCRLLGVGQPAPFYFTWQYGIIKQR